MKSTCPESNEDQGERDGTRSDTRGPIESRYGVPYHTKGFRCGLGGGEVVDRVSRPTPSGSESKGMSRKEHQILESSRERTQGSTRMESGRGGIPKYNSTKRTSNFHPVPLAPIGS